MRFLRVAQKAAPTNKLEFIDQLQNPTMLTSHIVGASPVSQTKAYDYIHISQIDAVCPREYVIGHLSQAKRKEVTSFPLKVIYNMGTAIHFWIQNHPETYFGVDNVLGRWYCLGCNNVRRFGTKPNDPCEFCNASPRATVYYEYSFSLKDHRVAGSIDLILKVGKGVYRVVDLKTTSKEIVSPIGSNVAQVASYIYFSQFDVGGLPIKLDRSVGYLVYFSKTMNYRNQVQTFKVEPTDRLMAPLIEKSRLFVDGISTKTLPPPKQECIRKNFYFAKSNSCFLVEICKRFYFEGRTSYEC